MLFSAIAPTTTLAKSNNSATSSMLKTEDVFNGCFSPGEIFVAPGVTFEITFSLCPTLDVPSAVISFVLPADLVNLVSGSQVWMGDLKNGELLTLTLSLVSNGEVEAYVRANVEASLSGRNYQSSYYLHVATSSSGLNSNGVSASINPGSVRSASLEFVSSALNAQSSRAQEKTIAPQSTSGTIEVAGKFLFLDENGGYSPARYMEVRLRDNNDPSWSVTAWTNATGYFDFKVANSASGRSPILDLIAEGNWDWKGTDSNGAQYWWSTGVLAYYVADGWVWTNYGMSPGNNDDILQAGDAVYAEGQMVYDWTGWMRSKVTIRWPQETWPHSHGDYIDLPAKTTAGWNHVAVQHEEGHCIMYAAYGNTWPSTAHMGESHSVFDEKDGGFAMIEGWAEFMECAVDNNPNNLAGWYNGHGGNIETNDWFNCITNGNMDGNIIEGSTASILWDIFDPVNIAGDKDHLASGYAQIFTVMQNDHPGDMLQFWNDWAARWPDNSTSKGPLCSIYYHYGIDEDWFNPWGSVIINGGATYTNSRSVTLTLDGEDWGVGVIYMRFSEDYGVTWGSWYNYAATFTYTITSAGDGWKYVDVQYADYWWLSKGGTIYDGIGLDTADPTGTIQINNGSAYTTSRTVYLNLTATDSYSGVALMRFSENGGTWGAWVTFAKTYPYTLTSAGDGYKSVDVQFQDYAVRNSTMWGIWDYILLDTTKPNGTVFINNGSIATTSTSVYLNLTYTDTGSGISKIRFGNTGDPWSAWETPTPTKAWTIPAGDGTKYVWCEVMDNAGLISDQFYDGIILDTVNPTGSIVVGSGNPTYTTTAAVTLYLTYADSGSGVYQVRYGNSGGSWSTWEAPAATKAWTLIAGEGSKTVWYQVMDNAGLTSTQSPDSIILDTTAPTGSIIINGGAATTNTRSVTLSLTYSDTTSGVYQVRYGNTGEPWSAWQAPSATKAWTLTAGAGLKTVWYQIMDNAGLVSTMYSDDITLTSTFGLKSLTTWYWTSNTQINSVASGDVDNDGFKEIVTGGTFYDGTRNVAQLIVWNGSNIVLDRLTSWYWYGNTTINSVAVGDIDGDGQVEVVTGGSFYDGSRNVAQLIVWNGANLAVERIQSWYWYSNTVINSVAIGDVDADGQIEVVTGGYFNDTARNVAQLIVWSGSSLSLEKVQSWYWYNNTVINSVAVGDADGDGQVEVVTGGYFNDNTRNIAQLMEWTGANLAVERIQSWYWYSNTVINSVAIGDVDADGQIEVVTGGYFNDNTRNVAQLMAWSGSSLSFESVQSWYWTYNTVINSVATGDLDGNGLTEVATGGYFNDYIRNTAQLTVWGMI